MKKIHLILAFISFASSFAQAQGKKELFYQSWWNQCSLATNGEHPITTDTMLVMYTTRIFLPNDKNFFSNEIDKNKKTTIVLAVCKNRSWKIFVLPDLNSAMQYVQVKDNLVIYVEGMGKNFPIALYRAAGLTTQYGVNVIMFDYPSLNESVGARKNFYFAERNSASSAPAFSAFLEQLQKENLQNRNWITGKHTLLMLHSMGNVMLREAAKSNMLSSINTGFINRLVFNAPCIPQKHHASWMDSIKFSNEIFVHYNKRDFNLRGARLLKHRLILGASPKKPLSTKAVYINFSKVLKKQHNGYLNRPGYLDVPTSSDRYYRLLFHGKEIPLNDDAYFLRIKNDRKYLLR